MEEDSSGGQSEVHLKAKNVGWEIRERNNLKRGCGKKGRQTDSLIQTPSERSKKRGTAEGSAAGRGGGVFRQGKVTGGQENREESQS